MSHDLRFQAVLFDLYQTLVAIETDEHDPAVWDGVAAFLHRHGVRRDAGRLCRDFFARAASMQEHNREEHPEVDVLAIFGELIGPHHDPCLATRTALRFRRLSTRYLRRFDDTLPVLTELASRYKLAVVSDAQRVFILREMKRMHLTRIFERDKIVISSELKVHKPNPLMFTVALRRICVPPHAAVYVGDHVGRDINGAKLAHLKTVLIHRDPAIPVDGSYTPDHTCRSLTELLTWLGDR